MRLRRRLLFGVAALLGACIVVLPAIASSETSPTIEAYDFGAYSHYWSPASATIAPGGVVKFGNPYGDVNHGLEFTSASKPTCTGIPTAASENTGAPDWHGECTFNTVGTYTFICTVHPTEMKGTITVSAGGATTTTMTMGATETPGSGSAPGGPTGAPGSGPPTPGASSLLVGSASSAVKLAATQHGHSVHGSVAVSQAGAGGTLAVQLLATRASLASAGHRQKLQVGRSVRSSLPAGTDTFTVALNARARHALRVHGRLALSVRILLTSAHGGAVTVTRSVVVRG